MTEQLPAAVPADGPAPHPIHLLVTDDLHRNRLTVFFRLLLAFPHFVWLTLWAIAALVVAFVNWIVTLIRGSILMGIVLIIVGLLVGPGGVSIFN